NTQKLYEICKEECANTYYIQTAADLCIEHAGRIDNVGITAGASTPKKIIEEVQKYVRTKL
ncbi:MAG: 4-hydroxy-3-methylbut-2-enyl diphosphate reductase, partial [Eubacterium sp.]|nr:4-hydroxy-3-methylbut-2-enyl diphosphate reductase [Eubacterium sp.]